MDDLFQKNELAIVTTDIVLAENQEKILARDGSKVFPITPALRKKLENLKSSSMSDLRTRIQVIKQQKHDEFMEHNQHRIDTLIKYVAVENKKLQTKVVKIMTKNRMQEAKIENLRGKFDSDYKREAKQFFSIVDNSISYSPDYINEEMNYTFPLKSMRKQIKENEANGDEEYTPEEKTTLKKADQIKRAKEDAKAYSLKFDEEKFKKKVLEVEFKQNFGQAFDTAVSRINQLELQFDESLLFGDMEVIKNVYYNLRKAEKFIEDLSSMELR